MSTFGHHIQLSNAALASLAPDNWLPTLLACTAVVLIGVVALALARECAE